MRALAELRSVGKSFGEHVALADVSFTVRAGEVFGLLGPNGAGKTTALRILCGGLAPDTGTAFLSGIDVADDPLAARRLVAFVPDGAPLYANLGARGHLELVGRLHGLAEDLIAREADRLLAALDLGGRARDPVGTFSRGMRQKVAIACALLPRPPLLVLDEPLNGLDAPTTVVIKEVLRTWADRGGAVLYTSHLLDVAERVCDRIAILDRGRLVALGTFEELRREARGGATLEAVFNALTQAEDPRARALRILGPGA
ncbi:MAG: ABC transporter ATP-binding protein [Planctomycetes bacterium]|nr:ABC transporter ATP-binding protein [Planctomycetota bacterium]